MMECVLKVGCIYTNTPPSCYGCRYYKYDTDYSW